MTTQVHDAEGKVIVITGASSGFGKGIAIKLAKAGAKLVLGARRGSVLEHLAMACQGAGTEADAVPTDVSMVSDVELLAYTAIERHGRIDAWINDAGVGAIGHYDEIPIEQHGQVIATNLLGTMYGSYAALKRFRVQGEGTLINVSSVLGKIPVPYYASYVASKFGIAGFGTALRQELHARKLEKIHVCTVFPMAMDTPFFDHAANYTGKEAVPVGPLYDPEMVVDAIICLLKDPKDEVIVGGRGKMMAALHKLMPGVVEGMMESDTHKTQIKQAPPATPTPGNVMSPVAAGTAVNAGRHAATK